MEIDHIPVGWELLTAADIASPEPRSIVSGPFGSNIGSRFFVESGIPVIRGNNLSFGDVKFRDHGFVFLTPEKAEEFKNCRALPGDLIFTAAGTLGQVGIIPDSAEHPFYIISNKQLRLRMDRTRCYPPFLFYWFTQARMREHIVQSNRGSSVPLITLGVLRSLPVLLPPLETQRRIAAILGAYDDLIEVNRRRVAVLEEMARGLFEEWFVRFRFPGHEQVPLLDTPNGPLPQGWRFARLHDIAEVAFGFPFKSKAFTTEPVGSRVVRIRDVPDGKTSTWTEEPFDPRYAVVNGDILIGMDGIFHTAVWVGGDAALNQRVTRLRPLNGHSRGWVFWSVLPHIKYFEVTISGTTVAHLGAKHLNTIQVRVAPPALQARADRFLAPIDDEMVAIRVANERLAASRDLLVPRLISGQLSLKAAERQLEDAA